ncbi:MAG: PIN domain-containing protein, partial [Acidobacteriota bacterium]
GKPLYYWESSIWITYFNEGSQHPDVFERIEEMIDLIKKKQITVLTSGLTRVELLELRIDPAKLRFYDEQLNRRNVHDVAVTRSIAALASDYRSHFPSLKSGKKIADAIHLATAVDAVADELHTTDEDDLLPCNGDSMLRGTQVIRPISATPSLFR